MRGTPRLSSARRQRGQSTTEYVVICAVLAMSLFVATPVGQQLAQGIRTFYGNVTYFLAAP